MEGKKKWKVEIVEGEKIVISECTPRAIAKLHFCTYYPLSPIPYPLSPIPYSFILFFPGGFFYIVFCVLGFSH